MKVITHAEHAKIHNWIKNNYGLANHCSNKKCNKVSKKYHWCLKKGKLYSKNVNNFIQLCHICHSTYDKRNRKYAITKLSSERIGFNVTDRKYKILKLMAIRRGISMKKMFLMAISAWKKMEENNGSLGKVGRTK